MNSITNPIVKIVVLTLILSAVLTVKFIAAWTGPTTTAPGQNVAAPINVGTSYQAKSEGIGATYFRSDNYCNAAGTDCLTIGADSHLFGGAYTEASGSCEDANSVTGACSCPSGFSLESLSVGSVTINLCYL